MLGFDGNALKVNKLIDINSKIVDFFRKQLLEEINYLSNNYGLTDKGIALKLCLEQYTHNNMVLGFQDRNIIITFYTKDKYSLASYKTFEYPITKRKFDFHTSGYIVGEK